MAQYTTYGYVTDENSAAVANATVDVYFQKVDSSSPDSKWNTTSYSTDGTGYYSANLGDNELLGSEAGFKKGTDHVYIVVSYGGGQTMTSLDLTHASFHDHTTISADTVQIDFQIEPVRVPVINNSSFPPVNALTQHEYTMSETSYADTGWVGNVSQKNVYSGVDVHDGHQLINTVYTWDEVADREVANNSSNNYTFQVAGVYDLQILVREKWNTSIVVTQQVTIKYNEPVVDFSWTPTSTSGGVIRGQELLTFTNDSTSLDSREVTEYTYKWTIEDANQDTSDNTQVYDAQPHGFEPTHSYQSVGVKNVTLLCYWNDGFADQIVSVTKQITVAAFEIIPEFTWNNPIDRDVVVTMTNTTTDVDSKQVDYYMHVDDYYAMYNPANGSYGTTTVDNSIVYTDKLPNETTTHSFQSKGSHTMRMVVTYYDGWKNVTSEVSHQLVPAEHPLSVELVATPEDMVGKIEIDYGYSTTGSADVRRISEDWQWNDVELGTGLDVITDRLVQGVDSEQLFTWQTPSRKPYSAVDGAVAANENKVVEVEVRYDNGWEDNKLVSDLTNYEAVPYEVQGTISYTCNIDNYSH